jgi:hypothetical protein
MSQKMISSFRGEHAFLSNMYASPIVYEGETYPSRNERSFFPVLIPTVQSSRDGKYSFGKIGSKSNFQS